MKYIKIFENFTQSDTHTLQSFCDEYLADLTDDGYEIGIFRPRHRVDLSKLPHKLVNSGQQMHIYITKDSRDIFSWNSVNDKIIPFLQALDDEYEIDELYFSIELNDLPHQISTTLEDIINDLPHAKTGACRNVNDTQLKNNINNIKALNIRLKK